jgi:hypothetical protein
MVSTNSPITTVLYNEPTEITLVSGGEDSKGII